MKKLIISALSLLLTLGLSACGGQEAAKPAAPEAAPAKETPAAPAEGSEPAAAPAKPAEGSAPVRVEEPDTAVEEAIEEAVDAVEEMQEEEASEEATEDGGKLDKLVGTTWVFEDGTTFKFKDTETLNITGGAVSFLGDNGVDASLEYDEETGVFELSAMGQSREGTWDGETLTVDGNAATMQ